MMELPPLVSKGSPIRAADQNKLINAVRQLAAGSVARSGGAGMLRSRTTGKKRPFEVSVSYDASRGVVASVEPCVWHGNRETVPAGIVAEDSGSEGADPDTWIVGDYDADSGEYKATEIDISGPGYIVLYATLVNGKVSDVSVGFDLNTPEANNDDAGVISTVVAYVNFEWAENGITNLTVLQYLNGDFWLGEKGGSGESYAGNPFAWTRTGERTWQLTRVAVMVTPNQLFGFDKLTKKRLEFWRCSYPAVFTNVYDCSGATSYDTAPYAPNRFWVQDGLAIHADGYGTESGAGTLVYAEIESRGGIPSLSWRAQHIETGSGWNFPWVSQKITGSYGFSASLSNNDDVYKSAQYLDFSQDAFFNDYESGDYRVIVPMAIVALDYKGIP
ncbi:MAG: hypothetical protein IJW39_01040, partial [Opitutales bacterium]|nr:hypothetical protein [Opitutales bacterium]